MVAGIGSLIGVSLITALNWSQAEVIWGLWISSLWLGSVAIFNAAIQFVLGTKDRQSIYLLPFRILGATFLVAFFVVHFGGFHFGHAMILKAVMPLDGIEGGAIIEKMQNIGNFPEIFLLLSQRFFPLVVGVIVLNSWVFKLNHKNFIAGMILPYINVVRMHLLVILIIFAGNMQFDAQVVLGCTFFMYCWPIRVNLEAFVDKKRRPRSARKNDQTSKKDLKAA